MSLDAQLSPLTLPEGTEYPGVYQELINQLCQYIEIVGLSDFNGINYGDTEPSASNRDRPWFKTDGSGNPIGWFSWDGAAWVAIPIITPSGATGDRPVAPENGTQFFDTTIGVALIYTSGAWRTLAGSPGDIKMVTGTVLADVLAVNPGWSQYTDGIGKGLIGALADGSDAETDVGADSVVLTEDQMPAHVHNDIVLTGSEADSGDAGNLAVVAATQSIGVRTITASTTGSTGGTDPLDMRSASRILFMLVKD